MQGYEVRQPRAWLAIDTIVVEKTDHATGHNVRYLSVAINQEQSDSTTSDGTDESSNSSAKFGSVLQDMSKKGQHWGSQSIHTSTHAHIRKPTVQTTTAAASTAEQNSSGAARQQMLKPEQLFAH